MVERRTENPCVGSSILPLGTISYRHHNHFNGKNRSKRLASKKLHLYSKTIIQPFKNLCLAAQENFCYKKIMKITIFDTETTGMPNPSLPLADQPHVIQFAAITYAFDETARTFTEIARYDQLIKPPFRIPTEGQQIHGITDEMVADKPSFAQVADQIQDIFQQADIAIAHNLEFDKAVLEMEFERLQKSKNFLPGQIYDTMKETKELCKLPGRHGGYKNPKLMELHQVLLGETFANAHNAIKDVEATGRCVQKLLEVGFFAPKAVEAAEPAIEQGSLF